MNLHDFYDYKNQLCKDLLTNERIVELLDKGVMMQNADRLMYDVVYPFEYIPDTVEHGHTFICCDVDVQVPNGRELGDKQLFYSPILYVWEFTHKSKLRLPEGGVRTDELAAAIADQINGSRFYGLGQLQLYSAKRFSPIIDFQGKALAFVAREWNHPYNPKQAIPANRKRGE
jgi:hypothetical protein